MSNELISLPAGAVTLKDGRAITTSRRLADDFDKEHKDVLRSIRSPEIPNEFRRRNFAPTDYIDKNGDTQPMYELTRDGFTLLAMGFTGAKAMGFKIAYIEAFNALEQARLTQTPTPLPHAQLLQPQLFWNNTPVTDSETVQRLARMGAKRFADHFCLAHERKLLVRDTHFFLLMDEEFDVFLGQNPKIVLQAFRIAPRDRGVLLWSAAGVMVLVPNYIQHTQQISLPPNSAPAIDY